MANKLSVLLADDEAIIRRKVRMMFGDKFRMDEAATADATRAEARFQKLKQAGSESWTTFAAALAESRKAFDRANQTAWDALKRVAPSKT